MAYARKIKGTNSANTLIGSDGADLIDGLKGNDTIGGGAGNDVINGGYGNDTIDGGEGNDTVRGGYGNDTIDGNAGNDKLYGGRGADVIKGGEGADRIYGASENDQIHGGAGNDLLYGDVGNDLVAGGAGADKLWGGVGNDRLIAGEVSGIDDMTWLASAPTDAVGTEINTEFASVTFETEVSRASVEFAFEGTTYGRFRVTGYNGGAAVGAMVLEGYGDNSISFGVDFGGDTKFDEVRFERIWEDFWTEEPVTEDFSTLGLEVASVDYQTDDDVVGDTLYGGVGNDTLIGSEFKDAMFGETGDDVLYGSGGADTMDGGIGIDTVNYGLSTTGVVITLSRLDDDGIGGAVVADGTTRDDVFLPNLTEMAISGIGGLTGDAAGDTYKDIEKFVLSDYNDRMFGAIGGTTVDLGGGNDVFDTRADQTGVDIVDGGAGEDKIFTGGGDDIIRGGAGDDTLSGEDGDDTILGGSERDWIKGGDGNDTLSGEAGYDHLDGGNGNDTLSGGTEADDLHGGAGNDTLNGGDGDDYLNGDAGSDVSVGGLGSDAFYVVIGQEGGATVNSIYGDAINAASAADTTDTLYIWESGSHAVLGSDWTITLTAGSIVSQTGNRMVLSADAQADITFVGEGAVHHLQGIDQIYWY